MQTLGPRGNRMRASIFATTRRAAFRLAIAALLAGLGLSAGATTLRAAPQDRQVAEWAILFGGSVRLEGQAARIREVTDLPASDFALELVDLVGTNITPPDMRRL